jgi:hypothetical protein
MPATARRLELKGEPRPRLKTFHASVLVTRLEEWWVEAETEAEARALLATGEAHNSALGERVHVEVEQILDEVE